VSLRLFFREFVAIESRASLISLNRQRDVALHQIVDIFLIGIHIIYHERTSNQIWDSLKEFLLLSLLPIQHKTTLADSLNQVTWNHF
jgi:hypothetical protein